MTQQRLDREAPKTNTSRQLTLCFDSAEAATAYAEREGFAYTVLPPRTHRLKIQTYADNFK